MSGWSGGSISGAEASWFTIPVAMVNHGQWKLKQ